MVGWKTLRPQKLVCKGFFLEERNDRGGPTSDIVFMGQPRIAKKESG